MTRWDTAVKAPPVNVLGGRSCDGQSRGRNLPAGATAATAPIVILFFLTQRTFIQGIALTGTKG